MKTISHLKFIDSTMKVNDCVNEGVLRPEIKKIRGLKPHDKGSNSDFDSDTLY
jgi:hypothetical protein